MNLAIGQFYGTDKMENVMIVTFHSIFINKTKNINTRVTRKLKIDGCDLTWNLKNVERITKIVDLIVC